MLNDLIRAYVGGFLYRLRGSGWIGKNRFTLLVSKGIKSYFAIIFAIIYGTSELLWLDKLPSTGVPLYMTVYRLAALILSFISVRLICSIGRDVSAYYNNPPKLRNNFLDFTDFNILKRYPKIFVTYRLTILGLFTGILLSILTLSPWVILGGASMGLIYWFFCRIFHVKWGLTTDGLIYSEFFYGAVLYYFI